MSSFQAAVLKYKQSVDSEIKKFFAEKIKKEKDKSLKKNYKLLQSFVLNGGKRLRPLALMMAYKGVGGKNNVIRASLSVEFFHNATLIEDDIMDEDEYRRNKPTIYKLLRDEFLNDYGEIKYKGSLFDRESSRNAVSNAILLGNILYSVGAECLTKFEDKKTRRALEIYNEAFIKVNEGQMKDMEFEKEFVSEEDYIDMAEKKSAYLVRASVEIGAVLGGASQQQINALSKYAMNVTLAFQIKDDLMDIDPNSKKGHELGSDIKQGKQTMLIIKALELGNKKDKKKLLKVLGKNNSSKKEIKKTIELLYSTGSVDYCTSFAKNKVKQGKQRLKKANLRKEQENFFLAFADFVINRNI
ncbi:polyprenyl synthetase family protein [Candidatus Woesearchaeota archaeon]|nr:polyprenyl synthetase family protein [Candidatus Woesearchaeota archaeon]